MEMFSPSRFMAECKLFVLWVLLLISVIIEAQFTYLDNHQSDCHGPNSNNTEGFDCNGVESSSCQSYLIFRSVPPYSTAIDIAHLLASEPTLIADINQLISVDVYIPTDTPVVVPVNCSCSSQHYQHNATYRMERPTETYLSVAYHTYQGLSTCKAIMAQNIIRTDRNLTAGLDLLVPLMCSCPSRNEAASGVKYLLTYSVSEGDTFLSIADLFHIDLRSMRDANDQLAIDVPILYPFTPILIPLTNQPTKIEKPMPPPPSPPSPYIQIEVHPPAETLFSSSKKWTLLIGIGIGAGSLLLVNLLAFLFCLCSRRSKKRELSSSSGHKIVSQWFRSAVKSLTVYKFEDLQIATGNFGQENRIKGSVYKGSLKGDNVAIKVVQGDVSSEINILNKINHSNIIRLFGFCLHEGNTYLVYECADNGSLSDWLHSKNHQTSVTRQWKQRIQIAYDVANALSYLHEYTNPPYVHKNLKTDSILLDANLRAKIANFGLARSLYNHNQNRLQLTPHVVGTRGYMAPEYVKNGVITPKLDVFAFGVVILELLSGKEAARASDTYTGEESELLSASISRVLEGDNTKENMRGFIDPSLRNEYPLDLALSMAQLAENCVTDDLNARPSMAEVLMTLSTMLSASDWYPYGELYGSISLSSGR